MYFRLVLDQPNEKLVWFILLSMHDKSWFLWEFSRLQNLISRFYDRVVTSMRISKSWLRSTNIPIRFISLTTLLPNCDNPSLLIKFESLHEVFHFINVFPNMYYFLKNEYQTFQRDCHKFLLNNNNFKHNGQRAFI